MPLSAKTAVPGLPSVPSDFEPIGAQAHDARDVGVALDVVDVAGLAPEAGDGRVGRPRPRLAALALDRGHQRGLFAADERARAFLDLDVEAEVRAQDVLAEQAELARLRQRDLEAADRQRVLGAAVDVAPLRADGVAGDDHAFDERMRIAFERRAVHERAGVALVGVADDVLRPALRLAGQLPLGAGGETAAAAAPQARSVTSSSMTSSGVISQSAFSSPRSRPAPGSRRATRGRSGRSCERTTRSCFCWKGMRSCCLGWTKASVWSRWPACTVASGTTSPTTTAFA